jgi:PIN domain nuclease of toxin-antitoxin system
MKVLLDTHALLWFLNGDTRLPMRWRSHLDDATLLLSDVSVWEISIKYSLKKLDLPEHPRIWFPKIVAQLGLLDLPIERRHVLRVTDLPPHHGDPFDRLLIAQALDDDLPLMTADEKILRYGVRSV